MSVQHKNLIISNQLKLIGNLITLDGSQNATWRAKAYYKAADLLSTLDVPAQDVNDFQNFSGIGKNISEVITELISSGSSSRLDELKKKYPNAEDAFKLTVVSGVGNKKAMDLYKLGITNLQQLSDACDAGKISNKQIVQGVKLALRSRGRLSISEVYPLMLPILLALRSQPEVLRAEFAGSVRRGSETVKDVDIIVVSNNPQQTSAKFLSFGETLIAGNEKARIMVPIDDYTSVQVDLLFTQPNSFGSALSYFTGSKEHNIALRKLANLKGHTLNEHGFFDLSGNRWGGSSEEELYQKLNLPWCPPELREGDNLLTEIPKLIEASDLYGDFHNHTKYSSDAKNSVDEMVKAAAERGLRVYGITDHVEVQYGWLPEQIETRRQEINDASNKYDIKVLSGAEVGVNLDGSLIDRIDLNKMDYLIASIHKQHGTNPVDRLIKAMENPKVKIIGHPTGRIIGRRDIPIDDWDKLFEVAASKNVAIEINGPRLDLPVELIVKAKSKGCKFVLNSDAHSIEQLGWQYFSLKLARRAALIKEDLSIPK
jgi:DNA polymerase (family X)